MMSLTPDKESLRWTLPESLEVPPDELKVRLDFFGESIAMYIIEDGMVTTRMVSANDIAMAMLREIPLTSGILPPSALWWGQSSNGPQVALWRAPKVWPIAMVADPLKPPYRMRLPMPGLIFICSPGQAPYVYAAKERPKTANSVLYHAPLYNLFENGRSCAGTHKYPKNIEDIPESFFASFFTPTAVDSGRSKKYPRNLMDLWRELDGKRKYPMGDLMPWGKVKDII